ncbi:hypothetical protein [Bacteroides sp. 51]|uniref:hypothetical protein n=1 Tax=Bacteroides sp. 51 TaxID=2302938 RepID=UPI0013D2F045|nr:hypothetical protein [Bacteroides sp. 51]NDV84806.1 hypothetical protein [Bacteroides sp. 51]
MGLFDLRKKRSIQNSAYKIGVGLQQLEQEWNNNGVATPMLNGLAIALQREVRELEKQLKPNGRTDWRLFNSLPLVRWYDGTDISFSSFHGRLNNRADLVRQQTGIDFRIWL